MMIEHSPIAFDHESFITLLQKISNNDLLNKAIMFYIEEQPMMLNNLLKSMAQKIDLSKCIATLRRANTLALALPFLQSVQSSNNKDLNQALNDLYIESEDFDALKQSVQHYENFDQLTLAKQLEKHELSDLRRISAFLYRRIGKFEFSI